MKNIFIISLIVILFSVGCEKEEDDMVNKAQACLNTAQNSNQADDCLTLIQGIQGTKAARVRCGLTLLKNGITQTKIIDSFKNLETPPTSDSPFVYLYSGLGLGDIDNDSNWDGDSKLTDADNQLEVCKAANSPSMTSIAHISRLGTYAQKQVDVAGGNLSNIGDFTNNTNLSNIPDNVLVDMGQYTFDQYCSGTSEPDNKICTTLSNAGFGTGAASAALAANLRSCFENNNCN